MTSKKIVTICESSRLSVASQQYLYLGTNQLTYISEQISTSHQQIRGGEGNCLMVWYTRRICLPSTILSTHDRGAFALIPQSVLTAASYHLTQVSTRVKVQINKKKLPVNSFIFQRKKKTGKPACDSNSYALHLGVTEKANRSSIHVLYHQSIFSYPWINGVEFSNYRHKAGRQR